MSLRLLPPLRGKAGMGAEGGAIASVRSRPPFYRTARGEELRAIGAAIYRGCF